MKRCLLLITIFAMIITLSACSSGIDETAIDNAVVRIEANELDSAIKIIKNMDKKTLSAGKSEILNAVIRRLNPYLNYNYWISTDYELIEISALQDFEIYQTIVEMLSLGYEESNVDDFIIKALQFRQYAKWNAYHYANDERPYNDEISNLVAQGDACKSTPSVATSFYQKAYDKCMDAYNAFKDQSNYGLKECSDYYYNLSIIIKARMTQTNTTSEQNDAYNTSWDKYIKIHQEYTDDLKEMWSIIESFPKKLY